MTVAAHHLPVEVVVCRLCGSADATLFAEGRDYEYATTDQLFQFLRCGSCGVVYLSPRPDRSALARIYPPHYYAFTDEAEGSAAVRRARELWELGKARDFLRFLDPGSRRVLDVGCGRGRFLSILRRAGGSRLELFGIDLDPHAVQIARERGFQADVATFEDYQPAQPLDLIIFQQVIEHVPDPLAAVATLRNLLAPRGVLVLETPSLGGLDFRLFRSGLWGGYHFPRHWTLFTRDTLRCLVETAGLHVVEQRSLMSLSFWTWSIHHLLLTRGFPDWLVRWTRPPNVFLLVPSVIVESIQMLVGETSNQRLVARRPS